jgi:hypothetical protein
LNRRVYFNVRSGKSVVAGLAVNPDCPALHESLPAPVMSLCTPASARAPEVLRELAAYVSQPCIELPSPFLFYAPCQQCEQTVRIGKPTYLIEAQPRCRHHGGIWDREPDALPLMITLLGSRTRVPADSTCASLGLAPGTVFRVYDAAGSARFAELLPANDTFIKVQ